MAQTNPGSTSKNLPLSHATVQGHMHKQRQNLHITKTKCSSISCTPTPAAALQDQFTESPTPNTKNHQVAYILIDKDKLNTAYQDLTGRFPMRSNQRNEYTLIGYHYNSNCIIVNQVKNQTAQVLTTEWENLHHTFAKAGTAPEVWVMENEILSGIRTAFELNNILFQLVSPNSHCRNLAERAIQTYKNHFKAGLATMDPKFHLSKWD